ncbi:MAG: hypothetical protein M0R03_16720 [Novosphingobium sp.]|nr:hypothetical protein [Novosphingobium sp.]
MKTQKEILEKINSKKKEIKDLRLGLNEIEREYREKRRAFFQKIRPEEEKLQNEIGDLTNQLKEIKSKRELKISERLQKWLIKYKSGVDWGPGGLIIKEIYGEDERFVLINNPGHEYWSGIGSSYGRSSWWIADTFIDKGATGQENFGRLMGKEIEGRLTKEKKKELLDVLEKYKKQLKE